MRKFIVKHYALSYRMRLFGKTWTAPRASRIMFPYFFITGLIVAFDPSYPAMQWWDIILISGFFTQAWISSLIPFVPSYFRLYPIKWNDLDREQKYDYGSYLTSTGQAKKLTEDQIREWLEIAKLYNK